MTSRFGRASQVTSLVFLLAACGGKDAQPSTPASSTPAPDGGIGLRFPEPRGGIVTVVYPIRFAPGD